MMERIIIVTSVVTITYGCFNDSSAWGNKAFDGFSGISRWLQNMDQSRLRNVKKHLRCSSFANISDQNLPGTLSYIYCKIPACPQTSVQLAKANVPVLLLHVSIFYELLYTICNKFDTIELIPGNTAWIYGHQFGDRTIVWWLVMFQLFRKNLDQCHRHS